VKSSLNSSSGSSTGGKEAQQRAAAHTEDKQLMALGQKDPSTRTAAVISLMCHLMSSISPFFKSWPAKLQLTLAAKINTRVLVERESVLARGTPCTHTCFVLSGKVVCLPTAGPWFLMCVCVCAANICTVAYLDQDAEKNVHAAAHTL
jgi:hypothetical protein